MADTPDTNSTVRPASADMVTIKLDDGRVVDVFPSGRFQVYSADKAHANEFEIPQGAETARPLLDALPFPITLRIA